LRLATSNFACSWGLPRPIIKPHPEEKSGRGPGLGNLPKIWRFFNICATAEVSNFKFCMLLVFAKAHHKITPRGKSGRGRGLGEPPRLGFPFNISATAEARYFRFDIQLSFAKTHHKIARRKKVGVAID